MTTPRLVRSLIAAWLLIAQAAAGATPLLPQLADTVAVVVREHPRGGVEVVAADGPTGVVASALMLGEVVQRERTIIEHDHAVTALAWAPDGTLLVAGGGVAGYDVEGEVAERVGGAESVAASRSLAASARHVFAVGDGGLWRARRVERELTALRRWPRPEGAVAATFHPRGYFVVLTVSGGEVAIVFADPEGPDDAGVTVPVQGLTEPVGLAYSTRSGVVEPTLYALQADGLYRLDADLAGAQQSSLATRLVPLGGARAMALGPDGAVYVIAADGEKPATLRRVAGEF